MKIGILTFHRALNYGAVLQCYALTRYLQDCGHEVEVVDYRPSGIEKYRQIFPKEMILGRKGLLMKLKGLLVSILLIRKKKKARRAFDCFLNNYLPISDKIILNSTYKLSKYDFLVMGSDQVWSPTICDGFDPIYWGDFSHNDVKLITYAASIGGHNVISEEMWGKIGKLLKNYQSVSVREQKLYNQLKERFSFSVTMVVDPTILVSESKFDEISEKPQEENYVLFFNLDSDVRAEAIVKNIANYYNSEVVALTAIQEFKHSSNGIIDRYSVTPQEFLGYFKYAKFVVTSSFHGTVFSVVFRKDFYSLQWEQSDRAYNFLKSLGLENRMINKDTIIEVPAKLDYTGVETLMASSKVVSEQYLKTAIHS